MGDESEKSVTGKQLLIGCGVVGALFIGTCVAIVVVGYTAVSRASPTGPPAPSATSTPAPSASDLAKLAELLRLGASGENTTASVAAMFAVEQMQGFTTVESTQPLVLGLQQGEVTFKQRQLTANVMKAQFVTVNREAGEKRKLCIIIAGAYDAEFTMWRVVEAVTCDDKIAGKKIESWKRLNAFVQKAVAGDAIPDSDPSTNPVDGFAH